MKHSIPCSSNPIDRRKLFETYIKTTTTTMNTEKERYFSIWLRKMKRKSLPCEKIHNMSFGRTFFYPLDSSSGLNLEKERIWFRHLAFFYFHNHIHIGFKLVIVHLYFYWIQTLFSSFLFFFVETPFWSICLIATYFINTCMSHSPGLYHVKTSIDI
jgi:hypothetical protein